jgi:hypothetical protein
MPDEPSKPGIGERWAAYRPSKAQAFWLCAGCVIAAIVVGFNWGGWVTGSRAAEMAETAADLARDELVAAACIHPFRGAAAQLVLLRKPNLRGQADLITKGGWVTVLHVEEPAMGVAALCVKRLRGMDIASGSLVTGTSG